MKNTPKHLNIIRNEEDKLGDRKAHPNLVIKEGDEYIGYTITSSGDQTQYKKVEIEKKDIETGSIYREEKPSWLTNFPNKLDDNKKYTHLGRAKPSLLNKLLDLLK